MKDNYGLYSLENHMLISVTQGEWNWNKKKYRRLQNEYVDANA